MTVTATAKRRRKQACQGNTHLAKRGRPIYGNAGTAKSEKRAAAQTRKRQEMQRRAEHSGAKKS